MTPVGQPPQYLVETQIRLRPPAIESSSQTSQMSGPEKVVSLSVEQPAANWLRSAITRIEDLTALAAGWDGYEASAIDAGVALQAVRFLLDHAYPAVPQPAIVPLADGGIQIEWHQGGIDLEISFSDQESGVFVEDHHTSLIEERPVSEASAVFLNLIGRLTARG